ncbi:MAG: TonB-dependent receptor [Acidobacteriota bacterium]|nr:TonB-dependent receptor [Acidobacteriota bacterium]
MKKLVTVWGVVCLLAGVLFAQEAGQVSLRGRVTARETGLILAGVEIRIAETARKTVSDEKGEFTFTGLSAGEIELAVGQFRQRVTLNNRADNFIEIILQHQQTTSPPTVKDSLTIKADGAAIEHPDAAVERSLTERDANLLSSVTIGDPTRAAQALPGVTGNDDLSSRLALRGAPMRRIGFYIDGVLTGAPMHAISEDQGGGSVSSLNAETIGSLSLIASGAPVSFGDNTAGVLSFETREGNREHPHLRLASGLISTSVMAEGPLPVGRGSWLLAARRSYLGYVIRRLQKPGLVFDFNDLQSKAVYDASERHQFGVTAIFGQTAAQREKLRAQLTLADPLEINALNRLVIAQWSYAPSGNSSWQNRVFVLQDSYDNTNPAEVRIDIGRRVQSGWNSHWQIQPHPAHLFQAGIALRWLRGQNRSGFQPSPTQPLKVLVDYRARTLQQGYYTQDTWRLWNNRAAVTAGIRLDRFGEAGELVVSPRFLFSFNFSETSQLRFGWSRHAQFPDFDQLFGIGGNAQLRAEKATHYSLAFEKRFGTKVRLTVELFDRSERGLFFGHDRELARAGLPTTGQLPLGNALQGYARGFELSLERRNSKRFHGWINYSFLQTRLVDAVSGQSFVSDHDQRHTVSAYGNFRFGQSWQLSGLWKFGSGLPVIGFQPVMLNGQPSFTNRNQFRLPVYSRFDLRLDKSFKVGRLKITFTAEFLNLFGSRNLRQVRNGFEQTLPFVPSGGLKIEW